MGIRLEANPSSARSSTTVSPGPTSSTSVSTTATPIPTLHHARSQLAEVEHLLLSIWTATLPTLDGERTAHLCSAHRAVHEALLLLDEGERVVADIGPFPWENG